MGIMNIKEYTKNLGDFFQNINRIMPSSEMMNVINEFPIPAYDEHCTREYIDNLVTKLSIFMPRSPIPFEVIDKWIGIVYEYYMNESYKMPSTLTSLLTMCVFNSPNYDWCKIFSLKNGYNFAINGDDKLFQSVLIPYDKPLESTHIRPLIESLCKSLKTIQLLKVGGEKKNEKISKYNTMLYELCKFLIKIDVYKKNKIEVKNIEFTVEEKNEMAKWCWPLIELVYIYYCYFYYYYFTLYFSYRLYLMIVV